MFLEIFADFLAGLVIEPKHSLYLKIDRVFDAWMGRVAAKREHLNHSDEVKRRKIKTLFSRWRSRYDLKEKERNAVGVFLKQISLKAFRAWMIVSV